MSNPVEFSIQVGTLPPTFQGSLAEYTALLSSLITVAPDEEWTSFVVGNTAPTSNVGPWLKTTSSGGEWWVWSETESAYVALTVTLPTIPANSINGSVLIDGTVTAAKLGSDVNSQFTNVNNRIDSLETTVAAGVGKLAVATKNAAQSYTYSIEGSPSVVKVTFPVEKKDAAGRYDPTTSRYTANEAGWYWVTASVRIDTTSSSSPTAISSSMSVRVNGASQACFDHVNGDSDILGRTYSVSAAVYLNVNDYIEVFFDGTIASGSLTINLSGDDTKSRLQIWKIA